MRQEVLNLLHFPPILKQTKRYHFLKCIIIKQKVLCTLGVPSILGPDL